MKKFEKIYIKIKSEKEYEEAKTFLESEFYLNGFDSSVLYKGEHLVYTDENGRYYMSNTKEGRLMRLGYYEYRQQKTMKKQIQAVIDWNKKADNNKFNYQLEASMLGEEFSETIVALKQGDKVEALDGIIDMFVVGIGTLHKLGLDAEQISEAFDEIMRSNYSKFHNGECIKNENGKIMKPQTYKEPDLYSIINK